VPGKFKDYIAIPKANGYQTLQSTLMGPFGTPLEIQIRTHDMHKVAEAGVASHWLYKASDASLNDVQQKTHQWLQSLLEIQTASTDSTEFLEHIKVDLFPDAVYVFTPRGEIKSLPKGATAVDFAYAVHTDIGNRCSGARINGEQAPLRTELRNGDRVEVVTDPDATPQPSWLGFVATGKARSHIRHYLRTMHFDESVALGERLLNQALRALKIDLKYVSEADWERMLKAGGGKSKRDVLADIGLGTRLSYVVARRRCNAARRETQGRASHPWHRRHGGAVRAMLPAHSRRPDHRPHQQRPRLAHPHTRLPQHPSIPLRPGPLG
jgi:GTP pyrophosphokinase